jgi:hypothetical protein
MVTSFADTQDECNSQENSGINEWQQKRRRHDSHMFAHDMHSMFGFNENDLYDFMTNPWLERI